LRLILIALVCCSTPALAQQVEVVRPTPRATGMHGWTIEVPTPGAYGSFEVLRGGRVPDAGSAEDAILVAPPVIAAPGAAPGAAAPAPPLATPPRTIQVAPVRPVTVAPVAPPEAFPARSQASNAPADASTVRVQRGPFAFSPLAAAAAALGAGANTAREAGPDADAAAGQSLPRLPAGARVIRIR
jgi:hypothetical protein